MMHRPNNQNHHHGHHHHHHPQQQQQQQSSSGHSFISIGRGFPLDGGADGFEFHAPPLAPIFTPTEEEFAQGPLAYVAKIRPLAEPYGICKIVPPPSFKPHFSVDVNKFSFTPRVQRLNEVEAVTRIKLNFLERLIKFWDLQGTPMKIPLLEKKPLDIHALHSVVRDEGGFESCTREKKWSKVAARLGCSTARHNKGPYASLLRQHYERILYPYDVFLSGATIPIAITDDNSNGISSNGGSDNNNESNNNTNNNIQIKDSSSSSQQLDTTTTTTTADTSPCNTTTNASSSSPPTLSSSSTTSSSSPIAESNGDPNCQDLCTAATVAVKVEAKSHDQQNGHQDQENGSSIDLHNPHEIRTSASAPEAATDCNGGAGDSKVQLEASNGSTAAAAAATTATTTTTSETQVMTRRLEVNSEESEHQPERKQLRSSPRRPCRRMGGGNGGGNGVTSLPISCTSMSNGSSSSSSNSNTNNNGSTTNGRIFRTPARRSITTRTSSSLSASHSHHDSASNAGSVASLAASVLLLRSSSTASKELKKLQSMCVQCGEDPDPAQPHLFINCIDCHHRYHLSCLIPPLADRPKNSWHCARCIAYLIQSQPQAFSHEFGFHQSMRKYTLAEFAEMADNFKQDYFRRSPASVPLDVVEKEFWRIMSSMEESVTVEYGADLYTNDYGSGFAKMSNPVVSNGSSSNNNNSSINLKTKSSSSAKDDVHYMNHPWNLNNLPILEGSVFKHIKQNISGMTVPWMYVGMCFSTFCWHNEDHWSYSINYLHFGEAKSWYGVPGASADAFEKAMRKVAPDLFESQPDLLHQLVTQTNPNKLMAQEVPIYRCDQNSGEFVITFPRSYHAGFNQGMNFAEAVNFAPPDWLPIGRVCVTHYSMLHRFPVFSHDELICKMALQSEDLTPEIALATYHDMIQMVTVEQQLRLDALSFGITKAVMQSFEDLPDDERQCIHCKTTLYLSGISCSCASNRMVCINDRHKLCSTCKPGSHVLKYRYSLDQLPLMLHSLKIKCDEQQQQLQQKRLKM